MFCADSRTHAGVDDISIHSQWRVVQTTPDRLFVLKAAGHLDSTQAALSRIRRDPASGAADQDGLEKSSRHSGRRKQRAGQQKLRQGD